VRSWFIEEGINITNILSLEYSTLKKLGGGNDGETLTHCDESGQELCIKLPKDRSDKGISTLLGEYKINDSALTAIDAAVHKQSNRLARIVGIAKVTKDGAVLTGIAMEFYKYTVWVKVWDT
jgi:hypothetical protein